MRFAHLTLPSDPDRALRCLVQMAHGSGADPTVLADIARAEDVPLQDALRLLEALRKAGLVHCVDAPSGVYTLARSAARITAWDVARALDPDFEPAPPLRAWLERLSVADIVRREREVLDHLGVGEAA